VLAELVRRRVMVVGLSSCPSGCHPTAGLSTFSWATADPFDATPPPPPACCFVMPLPPVPFSPSFLSIAAQCQT
jgi:hypothetical protein